MTLGFHVGAAEPREGGPIGVAGPQRGVRAIRAVQHPDERVQLGVRRLVQHPPVEPASFRPLGHLPELLAHEQQLLARVSPHVGEEGAHVRELLPVVARHPREKAPLAVHDLVVADRQHVVLAEGVDERERELALVVRAVHRIALDVLQRVVHPAHVPLEPEAESGAAGRRGDAGEARGFLGDHRDPGVALVGRGVDLLEERDRLEVLAAAVDVGGPFALFARVVEVEHRGDGVDAQPVDVELLEPEESVGDEEVAHLAAAVVEDVGAPVPVLAAAGIRVLVERLAVEPCEREGVLREVTRHPVHDHADVGLVEPVDEVAQVVGVAEAAGGGEVSGDLIAPRAAERVLGERHELDVREALFGHVVDQLVGGIPVRQPGPPRREVHLVHRHGARERLRARSTGQPVGVVPGVLGLHDDGCRGRRDLGELGHRVGLRDPAAVPREQLVLVG